MNLEKLKDTARKFEQKEDWRRAIEVYLKAIQQIESGQETSPDLSLYNRVGDLYLKTSDTAAAVRSYERAVDLYADQGFFNNAIALCGKILRVNPGRTQTYLKLAQLHARKNVVIEAKRNLIEFLERMNALGQLELAFQSVKEFADQFSGSQEIRLMLVELLRAASREEEAREQLEKLAGEIEGRGERPAQQPEQTRPVASDETVPRSPRAAPAGLVFLDTGIDLAPEAPAEPDRPEGLLLSEPIAPPDEAADTRPAEPVPGLERAMELELEITHADADLVVEQVESPEIEFIGLSPDGTDTEDPAGDFGDQPLLDVAADDLIVSPGDDAIVSVGDELGEGIEPNQVVELEYVEPGLDPGTASSEASTPLADLPLLPVEPSGELGVVELESLILDDPENPELHLRLADRLLEGGEEARGLEELELAMSGFEGAGEWQRAGELAQRLVAITPDTIRHHQKRVELAFRSGEREPLLDAYLSLGDALVRAGAREKATAVFNRVQEHDPGNRHAGAALQALGAGGASGGPVLESPARPAVPGAGAQPGVPEAAPAMDDETPTSELEQEPASPPAAAASDSFVDLGSMVLDEGGPRDTRMRIDRASPRDEDEQREFQEILEQFKRGIDQNIDSEDYEAHYDLGIAFKEMGLLDEAIAEFQKALRSPQGRLRTSEALGMCFYEKGQFGISETVLRRAVETVPGGDEAKIGLLYWLGRAAEAQGKESDAMSSYERALAVDIRFMDLSQRMQRLTADRHK